MAAPYRLTAEQAKPTVRIGTAPAGGRCHSKCRQGAEETTPDRAANLGRRPPPHAPECALQRALRRTRTKETPPMAKGIRFYETGGPEVLRWESLPVGDPGTGEVRVRHVAVGLNFADTYFRTGLYPGPLPSGLGVEASGVVEAVGPGVEAVAPGDRVAYTGSPLGAYSTARVMPVGSLVKLPDAIAFETAAAMMMRGLTSAYL